MSRPLVSVVIPAYNAARTIGRAVGSALAQDVRELEVIVTDDGSTDGTLAVAHALARSDRRVRVVEAPNRGAGAARNAALERARGAWVQFLDADDRLLAGATRALVTAAAHTGAAAGGWLLEDAEGNDLDLPQCPPCGASGVGLSELLGGNPLAISASVVSRAWLEEERFDPGAPAAADYDLWLRLGARGLRWATIASPVAAYTLAPGTNSKRYGEGLAFVHGIVRRAAGVLGAGPEALERALDGHTVRFSTAEALGGRAGALGRALELWGAYEPRGVISAESLAGRAFEALLHGACRPPRVEEHAEWGPRVASWWSALRERGAIDEGTALSACGLLAGMCVEPGRVASALISGVVGVMEGVMCGGAMRGGAGLVVVGHGRNGARVEREACRLGLACRVRDDRYDVGLWAAPSHAEPMGAPVPARALVVVTPEDDGGLVSRFPGAARWVRVRAALGEPAAEGLRAALGSAGRVGAARRAA